MKLDQMTVRILVRKNYGECFDFYTEKMGLVPVWGDRRGPYTAFSVSAEGPPCFAIFWGDNMPMFQGYRQPSSHAQPDTVMAVIMSEDLDGDYRRLRDAGVQFLGEPQRIDAWEMRCTYFRDPEGNLFELNDASGV